MPKQVAARLAFIPAFVLATSTSVHAALPPAVTTAVTTAGEDMVSAITAVIGAFVVAWGLYKLGKKMGWL